MIVITVQFYLINLISMYEYKNKQRNNSKYRTNLITNITKAEQHFKSLLDNIWIRYIFQKWFIKGNAHYIVDFYIPKKKICIEIDWSSHKWKEEYDNRRTNYLTEYRWFKVIRFSNEEVLSKQYILLEEIISS